MILCGRIFFMMTLSYLRITLFLIEYFKDVLVISYCVYYFENTLDRNSFCSMEKFQKFLFISRQIDNNR